MRLGKDIRKLFEEYHKFVDDAVFKFVENHGISCKSEFVTDFELIEYLGDPLKTSFKCNNCKAVMVIRTEFVR